MIADSEIDSFKKLECLIQENKYLKESFDFLKYYRSERLYMVAGSIAQTVWNYIYNCDLEYGIDDFDFIYFNDTDLSEIQQNTVSGDIINSLRHIPFNVDINNQARVHLWYKDKFGYDIEPIKSIEDSISRFPTTATSIGIGYDDLTGLKIYAPFGLKDLFSGIVRANKKQITEKIFYAKVDKWTKKWPNLKVIDW
jgi:hypothetical protein